MDMGHLQKNGFLAEKDYNSLTNKLTKIFKEIRVNNIRKILDFKRIPYMEYTQMRFNELFDEDFGIPLEPNSFSVPMVTSFNTNYFPNFELEYWDLSNPMDFNEDKVYLEEFEGEPLKQLPNSNFNSLALAAYDIEKEFRNLYRNSELWKISEQATIIIEFFVPIKLSSNFDITIKALVTFCL